MSAPRRGSVWTTDVDRDVLVLSSTVYNEISSEPTTLVAPVFTQDPGSGFGVDIGVGWAIPTLIGPFPKARLVEHYHQVDGQHLTAVNNMLFKILATPER